MPVKVMTPELKRRKATRALNFGPPNSWKTTAAIATTHYPTHIVSPPGEEGWATIPDNVPGLHGYVWEEPPGDPVTAGSMRKEVEDTVFQIIAQKKGHCRTLVIDGFHQMYSIYLNVATAGLYGQGDDFEAQRYGRAHQMAASFMRKVLASPIEYVIFTTWNAKEADVPGQRQGPSHEYPDLPGRMAKLVLGMFSVVAFSKVIQPVSVTGQPKGEWILKPDSEVWGSSVKMDPRLIAKLPARVPQNWKELYKLVGAAEQEIEQEAQKIA